MSELIGKCKNLLYVLMLLLVGFLAINSLGIFINKVDAESEIKTDKDIPQVYSQAIKDDLEKKRIKYIFKTVGKILEDKHYRKQPLDQTVSEKIYNEYLKFLDPNHMFFTQEDIAELDKYKLVLNDELKKGEANFAFKAYDIFKKRSREYKQFAQEKLKNDFDFKSDEVFVFDRRKLPYAKNDTELHELWTKKLKNDVLTTKLFDRLVLEDSNKHDEKDTEKIQKLWNNKTPAEKILTRLRDYDNDLNQKTSIDILSIYLTAVSQVYGPHSSYMSPKLDEDFDISMSLSLIGIGATLTSDDGFIRVVDIVPGGPAALDGRLKAEDRIIGVAQGDGEVVDVIDMSVSNAVKLIRGRENTIVKLTVIPGDKGRTGKPDIIALKRAKIALEDSAAKGEIKELTNPNNPSEKIAVGVISIPSFYMDFDAVMKGDPNYKSVSRDVENIVKKFKTDNPKLAALVIDLRNNGGGSLFEAVALSGLFVKEAPVVQIRNRKGFLDIRKDEDVKMIYDGPMIILNNKLSASASEIFAGAMRDLNRAVIVGDSRSYGKGTVLEVIALDKLFSFIPIDFKTGSLKYESSVFYRINGSSVQQLGIESDIVLPSVVEELEIGEMFNENHLPWDEIEKCPYELYYKNFDTILTKLKTASTERVTKGEEFKTIREQANLVAKNRNIKEITLNEDKRYAEYQNEKKVTEVTEKMTNDVSKKSDKDDKNKKPDDVILNEALNIAVDFANEVRKPAKTVLADGNK